MNDEYSEGLLVEHTGLKADVQYDEFDKSVWRSATFLDNMICKITYPLQLIKDPIAPASRHLNPNASAERAHATNLEAKATRHTMTV